MKIPKKNRDLTRCVRRRDLLRLIGFLLWVALLVCGALFYNHEHQTYPDYRRMVGWRMAVWVIAALFSGVLIFRIWKFFTDHSFSGTIVDTGISRSWGASDDPGGAANYDFRLKTSLKVRTEKGDLCHIRFEQKPGFYLYYHEGNRITHFRGLPYPINTDPTASNGYVCAVCGHHSKDYTDICPTCRHTLIDPAELGKN
ncbi:MAG: hypothetical protein IKJ35_09690 [Clostridia bacterium]|nr:hypothetical protein [Clostridia bacterium]